MVPRIERLSSLWLLVLGLCFACATAAPARPPARDDSPFAAAAALPDTVEIALVIDDASRLRATRPGGAIAVALADSGFFAETKRAWEDLARLLGLQGDDAVDALFGRRIVLVATGMHEGVPGQWAILSQVSPDVERRLRAGLGASPRQMVGGRPILAVEQGRYELATSVYKDASASPLLRRCGHTGPVAMVLLAPAGHTRLFDALLPLLHDRPPANAHGDRFAHAATLGEADALLVTRLAPAGESPERYAAVALRAENRDWLARAVAWPIAAWMPGVDPSGIGPWPRASFDRVSADAVVAVMGMIGDSGPPRELLALLGAAWPGALAEGLESELTGRACLFLYTHTGMFPELTVSAAVQVRDAAESASICDRALAVALNGFASSEQAAAPDFGGFLPGAVRTTEIDTGRGQSASLAWSFTPVAGSRVQDAPQRGGWWISALSLSATRGPTAADTVRRTVSAFAAPDDPNDTRRRVSLGRVRPSAAAMLVAAHDAEPPGALALFRAVESAEWEAWIEAHTLRAEAVMRTTPPSRP